MADQVFLHIQESEALEAVDAKDYVIKIFMVKQEFSYLFHYPIRLRDLIFIEQQESFSLG